MTLAEALRNVKLEPGQTYSCQVNGYWVELRVFPVRPAAVKGISESDIMLEPWVQLPRPVPIRILQSKPGPPPPPNVPFIPEDDDL